MLSALILYYYNPDLPTIVKTNASNGVVMGILL